MLTTTLNKLRDANACKESYAVLLKVLGDHYGDKTAIPLARILEICDINDTLWAINHVIDGGDKILRLFACDCAEHVLHIFEEHYPNDKRVRECIDVARRFAAGKATIGELAAARDAAWDAAWAAGWDAARDAALDAARAAARAAALDAAWDAGLAAEENWQRERLIRYLNETAAPLTENSGKRT